MSTVGDLARALDGCMTGTSPGQNLSDGRPAPAFHSSRGAARSAPRHRPIERRPRRVGPNGGGKSSLFAVLRPARGGRGTAAGLVWDRASWPCPARYYVRTAYCPLHAAFSLGYY